jgi:hypothetical protein
VKGVGVMPKENIDHGAGRLEISWTAGSHVQAATLNPNTPDSGWYVDLDRAGCNRAIRALRRARDHAYGRDE